VYFYLIVGLYQSYCESVMAGLSEHLEEYFNAGIHVGLCFVS